MTTHQPIYSTEWPEIARLNRLIRLGYGDTPQPRIPRAVIEAEDILAPLVIARPRQARVKPPAPVPEDWHCCISHSARIDRAAAEMRARNMGTFRRRAARMEVVRRKRA